MPWAGWYVMRTGWDKDDMYALFEVGPYGADHQHEDKLSFILYAYGQKLITECGNYSYDGSAWREYAMSARGHNVVRIDGQDQSRNTRQREEGIKRSNEPLYNRWKAKRKVCYAEGFYNEGFGDDNNVSVEHNRTIRLEKNKFWILTDTFIPSDTLPHTYETWFHFNTSLYEIDETKGIVYSNAQSIANIAIVNIGANQSCTVVTGQKEPEIQGWVSISNNGGNNYECAPVATPVFSTSGTGKIENTYLFIPYKTGEEMPVKEVVRINEVKYKVYLLNGKKFTVSL